MSQYQTIYNKISEMICDAKDLESEEVNENLTLVQLEFDSLDYVELMVLVKRDFNVALDADFFIQHPNLSIKELCEHIDKESES
ncbi:MULTISPECIES: acyl carrier protein [Providencia]|uniref:acyl carrier protein n=1 Tax=Providencia TaxID=586 RepID=UPI00197D4970|nr:MULTISPECIES: acyl carrier protein [Providencia]HEC8327557.1 acyl carrier protein [Providencia rettgeri]MBN4864084.1 acyl carrier protein [Providencia stuartii]MBN4873406.1 acyl carrier protein [Providencia stuartii]MBN4877473.1 acyl carrier protein [Providencia stuartii]MBN4882607.1 acyl carrier protein [Providencia stuartii]